MKLFKKFMFALLLLVIVLIIIILIAFGIFEKNTIFIVEEK